MDKNKKIILAVVIIVVIAVIAGAAVFFSGILNGNEVETSFDNNFTSGEFVGNVKVVNNTDKWGVAYRDAENHIEYNMSTVKNASFLVDLYTLQGMKGPEHRTYNDQQWDIYTAQGATQIGNETSNKTLQVFMCVANKNNQTYLVYVIFNNETNIKVSDSVFCDAFKDYVEPLLESMTLKHNDDAPSLSSLLGIDDNTLNQQAALIKEAKKGNQTAIQALAGG